MSLLVEQILAAVSKLPPFPQVAQTVIGLLDDPDVGVDKLVEVVQLDSSLTANVLKMANSAFYSLPRKVDNLGQALTYLGNKSFRDVVMTSISARLLREAQPGYDMSRGDLWHHSLATALMTQVMCEQAGHKPGPALYTAALLHDTGKVVLSSFIQDKVPQILAEVEQGLSFLEAEQKIIGLDHAQLGGRIAQAWRFTPEMEALISFHHQPEQRPEWVDLAILYLANLVCRLMGMGGGVDGLAYHGRKMSMKLLGFKEKNLELAMAELQPRLERAESMLEPGETDGGGE